jgi:hypothetical protein
MPSELRPDTEPDLRNDAVLGAIYYRFLGSGPFTRRFSEEWVDQTIRGHRLVEFHRVETKARFLGRGAEQRIYAVSGKSGETRRWT